MDLEPHDERVPRSGHLGESDEDQEKSADESNHSRVTAQPTRHSLHPLGGDGREDKRNTEAQAIDKSEYRAT